MKKALSLLLILVMLCGMVPMTAFATDAETTDCLTMQYDDHYDITNKSVEIIDAEDNSIIKLEDNYLVATGIGTAKVKIDD